MAKYDFWALGESSVTVSGGANLDGVTQGDGSHLLGLQITVNAANYEQITLKDNETWVDDNDGGQRLQQAQDFDGVSYSNNTTVEMEYTLTLLDPNTGIEYTALAVNFGNSSPAYATIEGICFVDVVPPAGVALTVIDTAEGPGSFGQPRIGVTDIAIPCFTPGTLIDTPQGPRPVEDLKVGDEVLTLDSGAQVLQWVGHSEVSSLRMAVKPSLRPILIEAHAFGRNHPNRDMLVSPQHRILIEGWRAEMLFGERQVLVAAKHLINDQSVRVAPNIAPTTYIHVQCRAHEVLISDGLLTESFNPGPGVVGALENMAREELQALFPDCDLLERPPLEAARPLLRAKEARLLAG